MGVPNYHSRRHSKWLVPPTQESVESAYRDGRSEALVDLESGRRRLQTLGYEYAHVPRLRSSVLAQFFEIRVEWVAGCSGTAEDQWYAAGYNAAAEAAFREAHGEAYFADACRQLARRPGRYEWSYPGNERTVVEELEALARKETELQGRINPVNWTQCPRCGILSRTRPRYLTVRGHRCGCGGRVWFDDSAGTAEWERYGPAEGGLVDG